MKEKLQRYTQRRNMVSKVFRGISVPLEKIYNAMFELIMGLDGGENQFIVKKRHL